MNARSLPPTPLQPGTPGPRNLQYGVTVGKVKRLRTGVEDVCVDCREVEPEAEHHGGGTLSGIALLCIEVYWDGPTAVLVLRVR